MRYWRRGVLEIEPQEIKGKLTSSQYNVVLDVYYGLVHDGVHPGYASKLLRGAMSRVTGAGLGDDIPEFRFPLPGAPPRPAMPGERCTRLSFPPGEEEDRIWPEVQRYRMQGWSVTEIEPHRGKRVWYACPPGYTPKEHRPLVAQAETIERF